MALIVSGVVVTIVIFKAYLYRVQCLTATFLGQTVTGQKTGGGAAYRWHAHSNENLSATISPAEAQYMFFGIELPSKDQLLSMSQVQIADLSPAEKFDIFQGNFDYPMTKAFLGRKHSSRKMRNSSQDLYWEGYCNAWSAVSLHYSEPKPVTRTIYIRGPSGTNPIWFRRYQGVDGCELC